LKAVKESRHRYLRTKSDLSYDRYSRSINQGEILPHCDPGSGSTVLRVRVKTGIGNEKVFRGGLERVEEYTP
jgi:hypothetical protein